MSDSLNYAATVLRRCDELAAFSEESGRLPRRFATPALRHAGEAVGAWIEGAEMTVRQGSSVVAGRFDTAYLARRDEHGVTLADAVRAFGGDPKPTGRRRARSGRSDRLLRGPHRAGAGARGERPAVIPGRVALSLDVRHAEDSAREAFGTRLRDQARALCEARGLALDWEVVQEAPAVSCSAELTDLVAEAIEATTRFLELVA